jgi:hypothetical protein
MPSLIDQLHADGSMSPQERRRLDDEDREPVAVLELGRSGIGRPPVDDDADVDDDEAASAWPDLASALSGALHAARALQPPKRTIASSGRCWVCWSWSYCSGHFWPAA